MPGGRKHRSSVEPRPGEVATDLSPGDLVVHEHHGIGRFIGMERMTVDGSERDFIKIAFAGTDFLYVPATSLDLISKYIGSGDTERVRLNRLGGTDWKGSRRQSGGKGAGRGSHQAVC